MLTEKLQRALKTKPGLKEALARVTEKYEKRVSLVGHITRETMHLMAVELQSCFVHYGLEARVVMQKAHASGQVVKVLLCTPEEEQALRDDDPSRNRMKAVMERLKEMDKKFIEEADEEDRIDTSEPTEEEAATWKKT